MCGETEQGASETYLPIGDMPSRFPMFCVTECLAWSSHNNRCNCIVMAETECKWSVNKITARILKHAKLNGERWWVKKVKAANDYEDNDK